MFLNLCVVKGFQVCRERFRKKIISNFAVFAHEISRIRSEERFYLERTDFGKEIDKGEREFRRRPFFFFRE